jgi:pimeloyl-ACP methyl ester carboxylesterase
MLNPADDDTEATSRTFVSQGLALHYLDWGNEGAPLLILVHGTSDHARSWDWTARALKDRFHVIALDLRGHGDSQWSPDGAYLLAYHVLDLIELIDTLGEDQVTIIGHSFGGSVASRYAGLYPDRIRKLVLVDGFGPSPESYATWAQYGAVRRAREWIDKRRNVKRKTVRRLGSIEDAAARISRGNPRLSAAQARHLAMHGVRLHPDGYGWKVDPRVSQFTSEDFAVEITTFWREITAPTLLCRGSESWTHDPEANGQAAHLRDRRAVAIQEAGHWPHHDQFEVFLDVLKDYAL